MNPKEYLSIQPIPHPSHLGLKIKARSLKPTYACGLPSSATISKLNYTRRSYQLRQCGYNCPVTQPYEELGDVILDTKKLILTTLLQEDSKEKESDHDDDGGDLEDENFIKALQLEEEHRLKNKYTKEMSRYDVFAMDKELKKKFHGCISISEPSKSVTNNTAYKNTWNYSNRSANKSFTSPTSLIHSSLSSMSRFSPNLRKYEEKGFLNAEAVCIDYQPDVSDDVLFRQLCAVNWILEAMSQESNPPAMLSISTCWNSSIVNEDEKLLQKRIEDKRVGDMLWQSFIENPSSFQYKSPRRLPSKLLHKLAATKAFASQGHRRTLAEIGELNSVKNKKSTDAFVKDPKHKKISLSDMSKLTGELRERFDEMKAEEVISLRDTIEQMESNRRCTSGKKFIPNIFNRTHPGCESSQEIQPQEIGSSEVTDETKEIAKWYSDLIESMPLYFKMKNDVTKVLVRTKRFSQLETKRLSASRFIRTLSALRPFELSDPDVSAAIEFIRANVVGMDKSVFKAWYKKHVEKKRRAKSCTSLTTN